MFVKQTFSVSFLSGPIPKKYSFLYSPDNILWRPLLIVEIKITRIAVCRAYFSHVLVRATLSYDRTFRLKRSPVIGPSSSASVVHRPAALQQRHHHRPKWEGHKYCLLAADINSPSRPQTAKIFAVFYRF